MKYDKLKTATYVDIAAGIDEYSNSKVSTDTDVIWNELMFLLTATQGTFALRPTFGLNIDSKLYTTPDEAVDDILLNISKQSAVLSNAISDGVLNIYNSEIENTAGSYEIQIQLVPQSLSTTQQEQNPTYTTLGVPRNISIII